MCIPRRSKRLIVSRPGVPPYCRKIGRFCFKCPTDSLKIVDVYPMSTRRNARGTRAYWFFTPLRRPPGGLPPFECQKAAKRLLRGRFAAFSCPGCWGYGIAMPEELRSAFGVVNKCGVRPPLWKRRGRRRKGPPARRRSRPKERKFQKGE